jgi:hypothetical protein
MFQDLLNLDKSPVIALSKKGLAKAGFIVTIGMISLSVGTGLLPLTVAGVSNNEVASAGCGYTRDYWAWWGKYTYLNRCAAIETAASMRQTYYGLYGTVLSNGTKIPFGPYVAPLAGAISFNAYVVANALDFCGKRYGQAYLKYPYAFVGTAAEVTCN